MADQIYADGPLVYAAIPNCITAVVVMCGCILMVSASVPGFQPEYSVVAAFVGLLADMLDGTTARYLNVTSKHGAAFDQLADLTCFGIGPAIFYMRHELDDRPSLYRSLAVAATGYMYMLCSVWRIARELVVHDIKRPDFFVGIPTNLACPALIVSVYCFPKAPWLPILVVVLSYMMVMSKRIPKGLWVFNFLVPRSNVE